MKKILVIAFSVILLASCIEDPLNIEDNVITKMDNYLYYNKYNAEKKISEVWRIKIDDTTDNRLISEKAQIWCSPVNSIMLFNEFSYISTCNLDGKNRVKSALPCDFSFLSPNGYNVVYLKRSSESIPANKFVLNCTKTSFAWKRDSIAFVDYGYFSPDGNLFYTIATDQESDTTAIIGCYDFQADTYKEIGRIIAPSFNESSWAEPLQVSPDGSKLVLSASIGRYWGVIKQISIYDLKTKKLSNIEYDNYGNTGYESYLPKWSPEGTKIAFLNFDGYIYVIDADGRNRKALCRYSSKDQAFNSFGNFQWSSDGSYIVYIYASNVVGNRYYEIRKYNFADGSDIPLAWSAEPIGPIYFPTFK